MSAPFEPQTSFPRLGYLYEHGESDHPPVPAHLRIDPDSGIRVEVPFPAESEDGVGRWFWRGAEGCPDELLFQDHELDVHLSGAAISTMTSDSRHEPGIGGLTAEFAVEDRDRSDVTFGDVTAVRSEIEGLHEFMGWTVTGMDFPGISDAKVTTVSATQRQTAKVGQVDGLTVTFAIDHWAGNDRPNVTAVGEVTFLRTSSESPRPLRDHLRIHRSIRDLVALLCWKPLDFTEITIQRADAPARALDSSPRGHAWRVLHGPGLLRRDPATAQPRVRFGDVRTPINFESLGSNAIRAWLDRTEDFARWVDPLLALLFAPAISADLALLQASIAAEAVGYRLALESGQAPKAAKVEHFHVRLARLLDGQPLDIEALHEDRGNWIRGCSAAYNGLKHANRPLPVAPIPTLLAWTLIVLHRSRLLVDLGVDDDKVANLSTHHVWWTQKAGYASLVGWPPADAG